MEEEKEIILEEEKVKIDFKAIYRLVAAFFVIIAIIVGTIFNLTLDEHFNWLTWLSNTLILVGITIIGMVFGEGGGKDKTRNKPKGLYQRVIKAYDEIRKTIDSIAIYFEAFYQWYSTRQLIQKKINYLVDCGMTFYRAKNIVENCEYSDYLELKEHPIAVTVDGKEIAIRKLNELEINYVGDIFKPSFKLDKYSSSYYLQALSSGSNKTDLEQDKEMVSKQRKGEKQRRNVRIFGTIFFAFLMGGLVISESQNGQQKQAWFHLCSRLATFFTSFATGFMSGTATVKDEAINIERKKDKLSLFKNAYEKKMFPCFTEQEQDEKELQEYRLKQENREELPVNNDF